MQPVKGKFKKKSKVEKKRFMNVVQKILSHSISIPDFKT